MMCAVLLVRMGGWALFSSSGESKTGPQPPEVAHLFNGKDLSGFYTYLKGRGRDQDPLGVFRVRDGELRISGEEWGCVTSNDEYENYRLVVEFKWGELTYPPRKENARDSGILVHSIGPDGAYGGMWMHSIECQVIEGGTGDVLVVGDGTETFRVTSPAAPELSGQCPVYQPGGNAVTLTGGRVNWWGRDPDWKDVKGFRGRLDIERPLGEWNRLECVADGSRLTVLLNGVIVNRCMDVRPSKGRIQIQSEGAEIFVRRVDILPLSDTSRVPLESRRRRFIYNSDGDNMFIYREPPMKPEDVWPYVDEIAGTGVTTLFMCPNIGMNVNYPGAVSDRIGTQVSPALADSLKDPAATRPVSLERAAVNLDSLLQGGHDPLRVVSDRAREKKLEVFLTFRLNEVHAVEQSDSLLLSRFWKQHPEWRIGKPGDPLPAVYQEILGPNTAPIVAQWLPGGLNFAVPEVRAQRLAELRECCERYPVDGLDLDFQRFPMYFPPGKEADHIADMTDWVRQVRAMTREIGRDRGRPLQLCARIMARPAQNTAIGLDPVTWVKEGWLDFVVVSHYLRNDFVLPIEEYRELLPPSCPIYASIEVAPDADTYRRIARELWGKAVDGLMLFNFFTTRENGKEPPFHLLNELGNPATIVP